MIHIFYHKRDLDGHCSGAIARYHYEIMRREEIKMWPYDYGEPFPFNEIQDGSSVIIVDITTDPYEIMEEIQKRYDLFVIDHHRTFINTNIREKINGVFVDGVAACTLAWSHFFKDELHPDLVLLLGLYDVWGNENQDLWQNKIMPTQMGMRTRITDPNTTEGFSFWISYFTDVLDKTEKAFPMMDRLYLKIEKEVLNDGIVIEKYQEIEDEKAVGFYSFEANFEDLKAICLNSTRFNSQVFKSVLDNTKHDIMLAWVNVKGERCTVSLYTDKKEIDVSLIAMSFSGGGHKQAAGFQCKNVEIITNTSNQKVIVIEKLENGNAPNAVEKSN